MKRRTKIVCTIGPAVASKERLRDLIEAGMNVARLNCSHGDWESRAQWFSWIRELSPKIAPVAILADLQGPKFRIGELTSGHLDLVAGQQILVGQEATSDLPVPSDEIFAAMRTGDRVLLGDGNVEIKLGKQQGSRFEARVVSGGLVKSRQGVTLVGKAFDTPCLTEKDLQDLYEATRLGVDMIALSYVRRAGDMRELRRLVDKYDPEVKLCAKIETREAVKEIDEIIKVSDLIMVARGDMGLQMDLEDVPFTQKRIIERCGRAGKPVITATQMLESMIGSPRPTRAEATDVANAILDGTDAVMLSGETAAGQYPIEAAKTMSRIAEKAEGYFSYEDRAEHLALHATATLESTEAVAKAAANLATSLKAKAIVTTSTSGLTPRMVSKFRPKPPILCMTWNPRTYRQLAVIWGVEALLLDKMATTEATIQAAIDAFLDQKRIKVDDLIVVTAGVPPGVAGNTNMILVETVR